MKKCSSAHIEKSAKSYINNHIISFRARLRCLDEPAHTAVWLGQSPPVFGLKVTQIREKLETLVTAAAAQSAPATGAAAGKQAAEITLENSAFALARIVVLYAQDHHDDVLAHKFDVPLTHWRRLRDEPLLQRARLLVTEADYLTANDPVQSAVYGVTTDNVNIVRAAAEDYASRIVAPHDTIAHRSVLTASLPDQVRALTRLFENIEDILPQFTTPAGREFTAAYHATAPVINRGHRFETPEPPPAPPVDPPVTPTPAPTP